MGIISNCNIISDLSAERPMSQLVQGIGRIHPSQLKNSTMLYFFLLLLLISPLLFIFLFKKIFIHYFNQHKGKLIENTKSQTLVESSRLNLQIIRTRVSFNLLNFYKHHDFKKIYKQLKIKIFNSKGKKVILPFKFLIYSYICAQKVVQ